MYWYIISFLLLILINVAILVWWYWRGKQKEKNTIQQIEQDNEEFERMLRETINNITHDLKTPLTAIRGYAQGILDGVASTPEKITQYAATIRNKSGDIEALVDELSFCTHDDNRETEYNFVEVDAHNYISNCLEGFSLEFEIRKITLCYQNNMQEGTRVVIDEEKMKRVFCNIVGNAIKYISDEKGFICITVDEGENGIWVKIRDNGIGIDEKELPFIFERFYRTNHSRNSGTGGSGLGLAIAKKTVTDHGGEITASSDLEAGTTISFTMPKAC